MYYSQFKTRPETRFMQQSVKCVKRCKITIGKTVDDGHGNKSRVDTHVDPEIRWAHDINRRDGEFYCFHFNGGLPFAQQVN